MMRIIETLLPARNLEDFLVHKLDSTALIHNILLFRPDSALIPPSLPLTIRPRGILNDPSRS